MSGQAAALLLFDITIILILAGLLGRLAERFGQPRVVGEIIGGILLGPAVVPGAVDRALFPASLRGPLSALSTLGVVLFMFLVGWEFDPARLRGRGLATVDIALGSALVPFGIGIFMAVRLRGTVLSSGGHVAHALFIGVAVSATALPVLGKILQDRRMTQTPVGRQALACAGLADALVWTLLAIAAAVSAGARGDALRLLAAVPLVGLLFAVVRPRLVALLDGPPGRAQAIVLLGALATAAATQWMGMDAVFGGFLFGIAMPKNVRNGTVIRITAFAEQAAGALLPLYFVVAGLAVSLPGGGLTVLSQLALVLAVAIGGKLLGTYPIARLHGCDRRHSTTLSVLMNARGLTELVILGIGLREGLVDQRLYSIFVLMAVITTVTAAALLPLVHPMTGEATEIGSRPGARQVPATGAGHGPPGDGGQAAGVT